MKKKSLLIAVSGHGFGHATRIACLCRELRRQDPDLSLLVHAAAPEWVFRPPSAPPGIIHERFSYDIGMVQKNSIQVDLPATLVALQEQKKKLPQLRQRFAQAIQEYNVKAVLADIPAAPLAWAADLGIPAIAMGNFSWDVMYDEYAQTEPAFAEFAEDCRTAYGRADLVMRLPLGHSMPAFTRQQKVPLLGRRSLRSREEIRRSLGLAMAETVILLSFGGFSAAPVAEFCEEFPEEYHFLSFSPWPDSFPGRLTVLGEDVPFPHEDALAAADLILGKPGYGLISECLVNQVPLLYVPRADFPECRYLMAGAEQLGKARALPFSEFTCGAWLQPIREICADKKPWPEIRIDGDKVIAMTVRKYLDA